jgi:hypothetical protein
MRWSVSRNGEIVGPVDEETLNQWGNDGLIVKGSFVRPDVDGGTWMAVEHSPFAALVRAPEPTDWRRTPLTWKHGAIAASAIIGLPVLVALCSDRKKVTYEAFTAPIKSDPVPIEPVARQIVLSPEELLLKAENLPSALSIASPMFTDTVNDADPWAQRFAVWSAGKLLWGELQLVEETTRAKVMKDPSAERGKRLCASGTIGEIKTDRSVVTPLYIGGLVTPAMNVVRFIAAGSSGDLVENTAARICGIVTGTQAYSNSIGGTTHAVHVVGLFDLPENRKR